MLCRRCFARSSFSLSASLSLSLSRARARFFSALVCLFASRGRHLVFPALRCPRPGDARTRTRSRDEEAKKSKCQLLMPVLFGAPRKLERVKERAREKREHRSILLSFLALLQPRAIEHPRLQRECIKQNRLQSAGEEERSRREEKAGQKQRSICSMEKPKKARSLDSSSSLRPPAVSSSSPWRALHVSMEHTLGGVPSI